MIDTAWKLHRTYFSFEDAFLKYNFCVSFCGGGDTKGRQTKSCFPTLSFFGDTLDLYDFCHLLLRLSFVLMSSRIYYQRLPNSLRLDICSAVYECSRKASSLRRFVIGKNVMTMEHEISVLLHYDAAIDYVPGM